MHILKLAIKDGLNPQKAASISEGEYHSQCPNCSGDATFIIYDKYNHYYCTQCQRRGNSLQYLRDFHAYSYLEACKYLDQIQDPSSTNLWRPINSFKTETKTLPCAKWRHQALTFIKSCHNKLLTTPFALNAAFELGFTLGTIEAFYLGWNPKSFKVHQNAWTPFECNDKKFALPKGIVIPTFDANSQPLKIKILRSDFQENSPLKSFLIAGSLKVPGIFGDLRSKKFLILEEESDAILVQQFAGDICCPIALGSFTTRLDPKIDTLLKYAPILFCLNVHNTKHKTFERWMKAYPQTYFWEFPYGNIFIDKHKTGLNIRKWVLAGLQSMQTNEKSVPSADYYQL